MAGIMKVYVYIQFYLYVWVSLFTHKCILQTRFYNTPICWTTLKTALKTSGMMRK